MAQLSNSELSSKKLVWLDCDPGHDDAMGIILAAHNERLRLLGVSTIGGNQTVDRTTANALKVLHVAGIQNVEVVKGSRTPLMASSSAEAEAACPEIHGESGLDGADFPEVKLVAIQKNCALYMYETIAAQKEKVVVVATGPLTNVAILLKAFPEVKQHVDCIVLMGGCVGLGNTSPAAEWNIECDPEAAAIVFESGLPVSMVPIEVSHTVLVTEELLARVEALRSPFARLVFDLLTFFKTTYATVFQMPDPPLHDPLAVACVIDRSLFSGRMVRIDVEHRSQLCNGRTVCDIFNRTSRRPNVWLAERVDVKGFWQLMFDALNTANRLSPMNS